MGTIWAHTFLIEQYPTGPTEIERAGQDTVGKSVLVPLPGSIPGSSTEVPHLLTQVRDYFCFSAGQYRSLRVFRSS